MTHYRCIGIDLEIGLVKDSIGEQVRASECPTGYFQACSLMEFFYGR